MRRLRAAPFVVAGVLALGGCGGDDAVDGAGTRAEEAVEQGREAVESFGPADAARETRELVDEVGRSAEQLAQDPDADLDRPLADAERRARALAERAERELPAAERELGQDLAAVNERLAATAADLRRSAGAQEARRVLDEDLPQVSDELRSAIGRELPEDVRRQLEQTRDRVDELRREASSFGR
jgi:hypothetical protein